MADSNLEKKKRKRAKEKIKKMKGGKGKDTISTPIIQDDGSTYTNDIKKGKRGRGGEEVFCVQLIGRQTVDRRICP